MNKKIPDNSAATKMNTEVTFASILLGSKGAHY